MPFDDYDIFYDYEDYFYEICPFCNHSVYCYNKRTSKIDGQYVYYCANCGAEEKNAYTSFDENIYELKNGWLRNKINQVTIS
jgi:hypothetical protein